MNKNNTLSEDVILNIHSQVDDMFDEVLKELNDREFKPSQNQISKFVDKEVENWFAEVLIDIEKKSLKSQKTMSERFTNKAKSVARKMTGYFGKDKDTRTRIAK
eukprot:c1287_g1_i1.p1 GENE.c1287_g1_i1~~c1287_g1_i1.p1  ORF type:complete len:104 (+),score=35.47 c1287_g1_i1:33-344(+)